MYAIIVTGGKQYRVQKGDVVFVEKLNAEEGSTVKFENVLAVGGEGDTKVGAPSSQEGQRPPYGPSSALHQGRDHRYQRLSNGGVTQWHIKKA